MYFNQNIGLEAALQDFLYTAEQLDALERTLSVARLESYVALARGNRLTAIKLYERNTALSQSLYGALQGLEIAIRNAFHTTLSKGLVDREWYESYPLALPQMNQLRRAKSALQQQNRQSAPGRIVAELSFGFWTGLTGPGYATLWNTHLVKAFPCRTLQRTEAHQRLDGIRKLRNRIAHHEPILSRPLERDFHRILDTTAWVCPVTSRWIRSTSDFLAIFATPLNTTTQP